ncbi:FliH/SctL family protein [Legionella worsleiensis]|uniref:Flagellar assembly protein FliH n=1 Tax=Legionella worsleiensis TaxID=45076 RepID=A0A0W1A668_9GAMM|nr:FliH/SctL family protein [Legionella worsleiensis]KTD76777.1 flagellar assembly protein H [Legionella worsleiensis]STY30596.1 flagellar assembly protein H [Legionella worsleiensis]
MAKIIHQALISDETIIIGLKPVLSKQNDLQESEIKPTAREADWEELREQVYQQGFTAGVTEGKLRIEQEMADARKTLENVLSAIPQAIERNRLDLHHEIAEIVLLIAQEYFIEQHQKPDALHQQINQILKHLNTKQNIELQLHPDEIKTIHQLNIKLETAHLNGIRIKAVPDLAPGGCIIKTEHGVFDISLETRLERLKEILMQLKQGRPNAVAD